MRREERLKLFANGSAILALFVPWAVGVWWLVTSCGDALIEALQ